MKIGLIGDVHAEHQLLERALALLADEHVERIACVGDIADGHGSIDGCVALLKDHGVATVRGNHDEWLLDGRMRDAPGASRLEETSGDAVDFLTDLPAVLEIETPDGVVLLCHGLGTNNMARLDEDDFDFAYARENHVELQGILADRRHAFVVSGHSHRTWLRTFAGVTFVKAGTLKREHSPGYAVLDTTARHLQWTSLAS